MNLIRERPYVAAAIGCVGIGSVYLLWKLYTKKEKIPTEWKEVGKLDDLMCFPIKSCGVVRLPSMECTAMGLKSGMLSDRNFLVISEANNNFTSARVHPRLMLIHPSIDGDKLTLTAPDTEPFVLNLNNISAKASVKATLWEIPRDGVDCGDEVAKWISRFMLNAENGLRLIKFDVKKMGTQKSILPPVIHNEDSGTYTDLTSYCLINQASIDDLNTRLNDLTVDAQTFRPNFVVRGPQALEEDHWEWVKIGDVVFRMVKYCCRCVLTTVDWKTGIKNPNMEPLATLRTYRNIGVKKHDKSAPVMGIHLALRKSGIINVGDTIYVA